MNYFRNIFNIVNLSLINKKILKPNIFNTKKSNTLFILGSGNSINSINIWSKIRDHDSLGFNYFLFNTFIPNIYVIESTYPNLINEYEAQLNLLKKKINVLKKTNVYLKVTHGYSKIKEILENNNINYGLIYELNFNSQDINELSQKISEKKNYILKNFFFLGQGTASIERLCLNAYFAGYKKIVLCGVDLNNKNYFFNDYTKIPNDLISLSKIILKSKNDFHLSDQHTTSDPKNCKSGITVQDVLKTYQKNLFKSDCQIYVLNKKSLLSEYFPIY